LWSSCFNRPLSVKLESWGMQYGIEAVKEALNAARRRYRRSKGKMTDHHLNNYIALVLWYEGKRQKREYGLNPDMRPWGI
jgi:hypothetical protein